MSPPPVTASGATVALRHAPDAAPVRGAALGLHIGYLLPAEGRELAAATQVLQQAGCATIRTESSSEGRTLSTLLAFMAEGDRLVLPSVAHLPSRFGGLERLLRELDARGAEALLVAERLTTAGEEGRLLRQAVAAAAELKAEPPRVRPTAAVRARALAMAAAGAGPGEIARTLQVSRMTIWRWLNRP